MNRIPGKTAIQRWLFEDEYRDVVFENSVHWFGEQLTQKWIAPTLLGLILLCFSSSISQAEWVNDSSPIANNIWLGGLFGWALSRAHFSKRKGVDEVISALYSILLAVGFSMQWVGKIVPPWGILFTSSFNGILSQLNLRFFTLLFRMGGWSSAIQNNEKVNDTGLFVWVISTLVWLLSTWLIWCYLRRQKVLDGVLPLGVLFGLNVSLNRQDITYYWFFLVLSGLLIIQRNYSGQYEDWKMRRVDYPEDLGLEWGLSAVTVVMLIGLVARLTPFVGTSDGWQVLKDIFRPVTQQTEDVAEQLFTGVRPPVVEKKRVYVEMPDLGVIGRPLPDSFDTVMWVKIFGGPPPPVYEPDLPDQSIPPANAVHYWRNEIYSTYNGSGWEPAPVNIPAPLVADLVNPGKGRTVVYQVFDIEAIHDGKLFSSSYPISVEAVSSQPTPKILGGSGEQHLLVRGPSSQYSVTVWLNDATYKQFDDGATPVAGISEEIRQSYLQLPANLPARVKDMALKVTDGAVSPYQKAIRLQNYLRLTFPYRSTVPPPPAGRDVVDYFLFETGEGFCSYYATAMAVMLRSVGVPARVVTGFASTTYDFGKEAYWVPLSASHAWVEVYFAGVGWVEFEPTANRSAFDYGNDPEQVSSLEVAGGANPAKGRSPNLGTGLAILFLGAAILLGSILVMFILLSRRKKQGTENQSNIYDIERVYWLVRKTLAWSGYLSFPGTTPVEFWEMAHSRLSQSPGLALLLKGITELYIRAVYSPRQPSTERVREVQRMIPLAIWEWFLMWGKMQIDLRSHWPSKKP